MASHFQPTDSTRANELLADLLESPFEDDAEGFHFALREGDLELDGDFALEANEVLIVVGNLTVKGCLSDAFQNEDDCSKLYVLGDLHARDLVCGSEVRVTGNLTVANVLYANSFDMDTLGVAGQLRARVFIEEGHQVEFKSLAVDTLITDDETWREVVPEAIVGDFASVLPAHLLGREGRFILSEALHRDLLAGKPVLDLE
ncbi:hypothetical protein JYJ95_36905 [Corallococcus exiguus]|uniref:hypothetical protein n=1 Tax=Corallococcus exiguus TaxID=83462 RepID=UPI001A8F2FE9|nr:hypothetical protein [Corallococcus exiguus]MBN8472115.1 hypothetical protein [Corallococcus exiguus]